MVEDTKVARRSTDRQHIGQVKEDKHVFKLKATKLNSTGAKPRYTGRVGSSCSASDSRHVTYVKNQMIGYDRGKNDGIATTTNGIYPWSSVRYFVKVICHCDDRKTFEVMTSTLQGTLGSVVSLLEIMIGSKLWTIITTERYILHMQVLLYFFYTSRACVAHLVFLYTFVFKQV